MTEKEKMLNQMLFDSTGDELSKDRLNAKRLFYAYNNLGADENDEKAKIISQLFGKCGKYTYIEAPFRCDYGYNIEVGDNFYSNFNLTILDGAKVKIGNNCFIAPNVSLFTASHPINPELRNTFIEYAMPITIGDNCWIGGGTVVNPGVNIGNNVVIGSGSVVTKDIPDGVIAAGNPAKIIRAIDERDKEFYFKDRPYPKTNNTNYLK